MKLPENSEKYGKWPVFRDSLSEGKQQEDSSINPATKGQLFLLMLQVINTLMQKFTVRLLIGILKSFVERQSKFRKFWECESSFAISSSKHGKRIGTCRDTCLSYHSGWSGGYAAYPRIIPTDRRSEERRVGK